MKLPAVLVLFSLLLAAISSLAEENSDPLTAEEKAALEHLPPGIDRKPGIMPNWEAQANIFTIEDEDSSSGE